MRLGVGHRDSVCCCLTRPHSHCHQIETKVRKTKNNLTSSLPLLLIWNHLLPGQEVSCIIKKTMSNYLLVKIDNNNPHNKENLTPPCPHLSPLWTYAPASLLAFLYSSTYSVHASIIDYWQLKRGSKYSRCRFSWSIGQHQGKREGGITKGRGDDTEVYDKTGW